MSRVLLSLAPLAAALAGCPAGDQRCASAEQVFVWVDADRDGFGGATELGWVCAPGPGESPNHLDCDDDLPTVYPHADEICDLRDDDCDGAVDEDVPPATFWHDLDGDGFGSEADQSRACAAPDPSWLSVAGDCDDADPAVHLDATEACNGVDDDCDGRLDDADDGIDPDSLATFYLDADADGFGDPTLSVGACAAPGNAVADATDCDDDRDAVNPGAPEVCDHRDNDCDGAVDDDDDSLDPGSLQVLYEDRDGDGHGNAMSPIDRCYPEPGIAVDAADDCDDGNPIVWRDQGWYADLDGDGHGAGPQLAFQCTDPGDGLAPQDAGIDCDDGDSDVFPGAPEICDGGIDDDCDGFADDDDYPLDLTTTTRYYGDFDNDGYGTPSAYWDRCTQPLGYALLSTDCDDTRPAVHPGATELCNDRDDDCDALVDDDDPSTDPGSMTLFQADADGDGYGDPIDQVLACAPAPGVGSLTGTDCDDDEPRANVDQSWYADTDGDGFGDGVEAMFTCLDPGPAYAPEAAGLDCDDGDGAVFPGAPDPCLDGLDQDCSGSDACASCKQWQDAVGGADGVYTIEATALVPTDVWCDMTVDGGGWTLVASSALQTIDDAGTPNWFPDLATLAPANGNPKIWQGLRPVVVGASDLRFTCQTAIGGPFDVDLSFYDVGWYRELTAATTEAQVCFNEADGTKQDPPPARRDNRTGDTRDAGEQWSFGYFEGEDACNAPDDFTIDFDDRGMDSLETDGTDWGEDDSAAKCGTGYNGQAWFVFVREP
ncbi:MAG: MopE-related protein [Myxococcota bacterium]